MKYKGQDALIDRFVPEFVQDIGGHLPDIPKNIVGLVDDTGISQAVSEDLENLAKPPAFIGTLAKESVDFITIQTPEYDQVPEFEPVELIHDDE